MKKFIYITGSSGSGSNMLAKALGKVDSVLGIGETHLNFDYYATEKFNEANRLAWNRHCDFEQHDKHVGRFKGLLVDLENSEFGQASTHMVFKRSMITGDEYRSDVRDMLIHYPDTKVLVMYRKPQAAAYSSLRRRLGKNLRHCAIIQDEQLSILSREVLTLSTDKCLVVSYEGFCSNKMKYADLLADFCELPADKVRTAIAELEVDASRMDRWATQLGSAKTERLSRFFRDRAPHWAELRKREALARP